MKNVYGKNKIDVHTLEMIDLRTTVKDTTVLHLVCGNPHLTVELLQFVMSRYKLDTPCAARTPLHVICEIQSWELVECVLGCNLAVADEFARTPMHSLCRRMLPTRLVERILATELLYMEDVYFETPLLLLARFNSHMVSAKLNVANSLGTTLTHRLCEMGIIPDSDLLVKDFFGNTPLHALCKTRVTLAEIQHLDLCVANQVGHTPVFNLCKSKYVEPDVWQYLLARYDLLQPDYRHVTPLQKLCRICDLSTLKIICNKFDRNTVLDARGNRLVHFVCRNPRVSLEMLEMFSVTCNDYERTPLHILCKYVRVSPAMLKYAPLTDQDINGDTPVHFLCRSNYLECINYIDSELLLIKNVEEETPLHLLLANPRINIEMIKSLREKNILKFIRREENIYGETPLYRYCENPSINLRDFTLLFSAKAFARYALCHIVFGNKRVSTSIIRFLTLHTNTHVHNSVGYTPSHMLAPHANKHMLKYMNFSALDDFGMSAANYLSKKILVYAIFSYCLPYHLHVNNLLYKRFCTTTVLTTSTACKLPTYLRKRCEFLLWALRPLHKPLIMMIADFSFRQY